MCIRDRVTAVLMAPIALQSAIQIGVSPVPFVFAVTVAASMCFASPFSTPPNALAVSYTHLVSALDDKERSGSGFWYLGEI